MLFSLQELFNFFISFGYSDFVLLGIFHFQFLVLKDVCLFRITLMRCNSELMQKKEDMIAEAYKLAASVDLFVLRCTFSFI